MSKAISSSPAASPFNFAPYNFFQRPDERYTFGAFADYEISSGFKPYLEAMFMDDRSLSQIAPSGNFFNTNTINCDNPLLSPQQFEIVCRPDNIIGSFTDPVTGNEVDVATLYIGRRNVEGGGRQDDLQHTAYRIVAGMRGDMFKGVSYDGYYQYGRTLRQQTYKNDFSVTRLQRALDVITDPATGLPVCRSVLTGEDPACVPWNIFTTGGVTAAGDQLPPGSCQPARQGRRSHRAHRLYRQRRRLWAEDSVGGKRPRLQHRCGISQAVA